MNSRVLYICVVLFGTSLLAMERAPLALSSSPKARSVPIDVVPLQLEKAPMGVSPSSKGKTVLKESGSPAPDRVTPVLPTSPKAKIRLSDSGSEGNSSTNFLSSLVKRLSSGKITLPILGNEEEQARPLSPTKKELKPKEAMSPKMAAEQRENILAEYKAKKKYAHVNWANLVPFKLGGHQAEYAAAASEYKNAFEKAKELYRDYLCLRLEKGAQSPREFNVDLAHEHTAHFLKILYKWELESAAEYWRRIKVTLNTTLSPRASLDFVVGSIVEREKARRAKDVIVHEEVQDSKKVSSEPRLFKKEDIVQALPAERMLHELRAISWEETCIALLESSEEGKAVTKLSGASSEPQLKSSESSNEDQNGPNIKRLESGAIRFNRLPPAEPNNPLHVRNQQLDEPLARHVTAAQSFYKKWVKCVNPTLSKSERNVLVEKGFRELKKKMVEKV